jgi:CRP/FNR family cyclic AMP-dependent transcriptional regulator
MPDRIVAGREVLITRGWLSRTPIDFQEALFSFGIWRGVATGEQFTRAGENEGGMFGVADGVFEVSVESGHPDTPFVHLAHPGFWGGHRPLLGTARNLTVTARTDALVLLLPELAMKQLLQRTPEYWRLIAQLANESYEIGLQILVDLTRHDGACRVAATLLRLGACRGKDKVSSDGVEIRVAQTEIAALAVMSRNTFGTYLAELAELGLIEIGYRKITIRNAAGLQDLLDREE